MFDKKTILAQAKTETSLQTITKNASVDKMWHWNV